MNDFAKSQLLKYGWSEGKGLGKHESGITQAIRPKLKFDTAGVGHKDKDWNNWWENAFNKAASNIKVDYEWEGVSISVSKESTTDDYIKQNLNYQKSKYSANYENFLKSSTLLDGILVAENNVPISKEQKIEETIAKVSLTDDELFKICGGRTAHKGARHGLTLNGKLQRIAQQEKDLLDANSCSSILEKLQNNNNIFKNDGYEKINDENTILRMISTEEITSSKASKSARKKNKRRMNDLSHQLNILCNVGDNEGRNVRAIAEEKLRLEKERKSRKKKQKKKRKESLLFSDIGSAGKEETDNKLNDDTPLPVSQSSSKKLPQKNAQKEDDSIKEEYTDVSMHAKRKKLKKKKSQDEQFHGSKAKIHKKSHKCDLDLQQLVKDEESRKNVGSSVGGMESLPELLDTYLKKKVDYLNYKIEKKKRAKLRKKERMKVDIITEGLKAVHFNNKESASIKGTKKKMQEAVDKMMEADIAIDKTEHLKKKKKKSKKDKTN